MDLNLSQSCSQNCVLELTRTVRIILLVGRVSDSLDTLLLFRSRIALTHRLIGEERSMIYFPGFILTPCKTGFGYLTGACRLHGARWPNQCERVAIMRPIFSEGVKVMQLSCRLVVRRRFGSADR